MAAVISKRDWASLPSPLLCSIAERLIPMAYARICALCMHWASSLSPEEREEGQQRPYYLPRSPRCPWLMVPSEQDEFTGSITFLSLPESLRPYRIIVPELINKRIIGSHAGWFGTIDTECNMCLINPLTRTQIPLPSITTVPGVSIVRDSSKDVKFVHINTSSHTASMTVYNFINYRIEKMILSSSPSSSDDYMVVLIFEIEWFLLFMKAGDTAWSLVSPCCPSFIDAVFVNRKLFAITRSGAIHAIDFSELEPQLTVIASNNDMGLNFIVHSPELNKLLLISNVLDKKGYGRSVIVGENKFVVQELDLTERGNKSRIVVKDIGRHSIFIDRNQSCIVPTQEVSGLMQNCLYLTDDHQHQYLYKCSNPRIIGVYNLKEETHQSLYDLYGIDAEVERPLPVWFSPMLF